MIVCLNMLLSKLIGFKSLTGSFFSYAVVKLNFDKVISYIFAEDKTSSKVIYDILRKDNYKNKASHEGVFAIKILKTYFNEFKYKNLRKDPIAFLRGSKC